MRITIVLGPFLPVPPVLGGAVEKAQLALAEAYAAAGHTVTIVSRRYNNLSAQEVIHGVRHIRVPSRDRIGFLLFNLAGDLIYAMRAAECLPRSDITITNSFSLPLVLRRKTSGKIYVHVARFPKYQMFLYSRADRLQAVSRAVAAAISRQAPWLSSKVVAIGYPISESYCFLSAVKTKTILYVGRIAREKGIHLLLEAFRLIWAERESGEVVSWRLKIIGPHEIAQGGDGPEYLRELFRLAEGFKSTCEFCGPMFDERRLIAEYQSAAIFVYPSLADKGEAFGLAVLEAMAAGCATVVSSLACFDDFVDDGNNALKFQHNCSSPHSNLATALKKLVSNPQLLTQVSRNGIATARKFLTPQIADKMLDDFESILPSDR